VQRSPSSACFKPAHASKLLELFHERLCMNTGGNLHYDCYVIQGSLFLHRALCVGVLEDVMKKLPTLDLFRTTARRSNSFEARKSYLALLHLGIRICVNVNILECTLVSLGLGSFKPFTRFDSPRHARTKIGERLLHSLLSGIPGYGAVKSTTVSTIWRRNDKKRVFISDL